MVLLCCSKKNSLSSILVNLCLPSLIAKTWWDGELHQSAVKTNYQRSGFVFPISLLVLSLLHEMLSTVTTLPLILLQESLLVNDMKYPHIVHIEEGITEDVISKVSYAVGTQVIDLEGRLQIRLLQCQLVSVIYSVLCLHQIIFIIAIACGNGVGGFYGIFYFL